MTTKPAKRVWIGNKNQHDYSNAERFGEVIFLTDGPVSRFAVVQLHKQIEDKMKSSTSEDFIVISGLPIICCIMTAIQAEKFGTVNYLIYSPTDGYTIRTLDTRN